MPVPASSRMIWPPEAGSSTTWVAAPAVVAGWAVWKVIAPDCVASPTVIVPLALVTMRASSASVRLMPAQSVSVPPKLIGLVDCDERIVTWLVAASAGVILRISLLS